MTQYIRRCNNFLPITMTTLFCSTPPAASGNAQTR